MHSNATQENDEQKLLERYSDLLFEITSNESGIVHHLDMARTFRKNRKEAHQKAVRIAKKARHRTATSFSNSLIWN